MLIWRGEGKSPKTFEFKSHPTHQDAVDRAIWFNETYYHPTQTGETP